jgi:hypothetical protein
MPTARPSTLAGSALWAHRRMPPGGWRWQSVRLLSGPDTLRDPSRRHLLRLLPPCCAVLAGNMEDGLQVCSRPRLSDEANSWLPPGPRYDLRRSPGTAGWLFALLAVSREQCNEVHDCQPGYLCTRQNNLPEDRGTQACRFAPQCKEYSLSTSQDPGQLRFLAREKGVSGYGQGSHFTVPGPSGSCPGEPCNRAGRRRR